MQVSGWKGFVLFSRGYVLIPLALTLPQRFVMALVTETLKRRADIERLLGAPGMEALGQQARDRALLYLMVYDHLWGKGIQVSPLVLQEASAWVLTIVKEKECMPASLPKLPRDLLHQVSALKGRD
jgi:hypothetical protein